MKIVESTVKKLTISELENLDTVHVILEDYQIAQGMLTITCYGQSWSSYWGAMDNRDLATFLSDANIDYITNKLFPSSMNRWVVDYDEISKKIETEIDENSLLLHEDKVIEEYGYDWRFELPRKVNPHWESLYYIVSIIKEAIASMSAKVESK